MAEFQEVIKQWKRRCEHCDKNEQVWCCINGYVCDGFCKMRKYINPEFIEHDVMQWAAEHPEPVYPTWGEYLMSLIMPYGTGDWSTLLLEHRISADIASKLGIQPKEGNHD